MDDKQDRKDEETLKGRRVGDPATYTDAPVKLHVNWAAEDLVHVGVSVPGAGLEPWAAAEHTYQQVAELCRHEKLEVIHERLFGSIGASSAVLEARRLALEREGLDPATPITYMEGCPVWGAGFAGALLLAVRRSRHLEGIWTIRDEQGTPCGRGYRRRGLTVLTLQGLHGMQSAEADSGAPAEAARMFDRAGRILRSQGVSYHSVTRTWIYLRRILDWYGEFNQVRNAAYSRLRLMPDSEGVPPERLALPASTGIAGSNPLGAACVMDLLAVIEPPHRPSIITQMTNVHQKDAFRYGSAFSRGAAIEHPDFLQIEISGTAAIGERGESLFLNDVRGQIERTLDDVEALLAQRGATFRDIREATVFFKRPQDAAVYGEIVAARKLTALPAVSVVADICRDELLFEIDGTATIRSTPR